jgi:AraC-like DNA-binding protein
LTWDEIAQRVGYANGENAIRAVRRWRRSLPALDVERMRDEAIARGEWLLRKAAEDVEEDRPGGVTAMVRAEGRLAALVGLDAPRRSITESHEQRVEAVFAWLAGPEDRPPWELPAGSTAELGR